jgi:diacylglycerol kinase family enzyme
VTGPVAVVFNPASGMHSSAHREKAIRQAFERAGAADGLLWLPTSRDDPGAGMAAEAVRAGAGLVVASGGDGTVRGVAAGLAGTGVPLGVLAQGTGNLLARNLGIPVHLDRPGRLDKAVDVALHGVRRPIDVGMSQVAVGGSACFLIMAGMGFDAAMLAGTNPVLKRRFGTLAYARSGMAELRYHPARFTLTIDGKVHRPRKASCILVANVGRITGDLEVVKGAEPDDGLLDVAIIRARTPLQWAQVASRIMLHSRWGDVRVELLRGRSVQISSDELHLVEHDGDVGDAVDSLSVTALPGALTVCVARGRLHSAGHSPIAATVKSSDGRADPRAPSTSDGH